MISNEKTNVCPNCVSVSESLSAEPDSSKRRPGASSARAGISEVEILGYNTISEKFGRTIVGDEGKFANFLSNGWDGETLTWEGRVSNMATKQMAKHQLVVTKTNDRAFTEIENMSKEDGTWMLVSEKTCTKPEAL